MRLYRNECNEAEGHLKVTGNHTRSKTGNISKTVQDRDVFITVTFKVIQLVYVFFQMRFLVLLSSS